MGATEDQFTTDEQRWQDYRTLQAEARRQAVEGPGEELETDLTNTNMVMLILNGMFLYAWRWPYITGLIGEKGCQILAHVAAKNHPGLEATAGFLGGVFGTLAGDPAAKVMLAKYTGKIGKEAAEEAALALERVMSKEAKDKVIELNKYNEIVQGEPELFRYERPAPKVEPQRQLELPLKEPALAPERPQPSMKPPEGKSPQWKLGFDIPTARQVKNHIYKSFEEALGSEDAEHAEKQVEHANQLSKRSKWWYTQFINSTLLWPRFESIKIFADLLNQPVQATWRSLAVASREGPTAGVRTMQAAMAAWRDTVPEAWKFMKIAFREDRPAWIEDVLKRKSSLGWSGSEQVKGAEKGINEALNRSNPYTSSVFRWIHAAVSSGRRGVMSANEFSQAMAFRANMRMGAYIEALEEGAKEGLSETARILFADARADQILAHPTEALVARAEQNMYEQTFTAHGKLIQMANEFANLSLPTRLGAAYITVPGNLLRQGFAHSPFAPLTESALGLSTESIEARTAVVKMLAGVALWNWAAHKVAKNELFGHGPYGRYKDFWPGRTTPTSIKIGDNWYDYSRIGPLGESLAMAADATEMYYMSKDPNQASRMFDAVANSLAHTASHGPMVEWLGNMKHLMDQAQSSGGAAKPTEEMITRMFQGFIPNPVRQWEQLRDPRERTGEVTGTEAMGMDSTQKFATEVVRQFSTSIPGWADHRQIKLDWRGNPIYPPTAMSDGELATLPMRIVNSMSPIVAHGKTPELDPVEHELFTHGIKFNQKYDRIFDKDPQHVVPLPEDQQNEWRILTGKGKMHLSDAGTVDVHDALAWVMQQPWYRTAKTANQTKMLEGFHRAYYEQAKQTIFTKYGYKDQVIKAATASAAPVPGPPLPKGLPGGLPPMGVNVPKVSWEETPTEAAQQLKQWMAPDSTPSVPGAKP